MNEPYIIPEMEILEARSKEDILVLVKLWAKGKTLKFASIKFQAVVIDLNTTSIFKFYAFIQYQEIPEK